MGIQRFQEMYDELQSAYALKEKELNELRSANKINQNASYKLSDDLTKTQQINKKLRLKIDELSKNQSKDQNMSSQSGSEDSDIILVNKLSDDKQNLEEELSKVKEELHDFKKKTKSKWDGVKSKFQSQRQNLKQLEQENKDLKLKLQ